MKYFIVGLHSAGKQEVVNCLEKMGINCGKIFSNIEKPSEKLYNSHNYELYSNEDINEIFENNAYVFIQEISKMNMDFDNNKYYEGLSKYSLDRNEVFILSPDQLLAITPNTLPKDICFVWLDSTKTRRVSRYHSEHRAYNYYDRESQERRDLSSFVKALYSYNAPILYFIDEEPPRVASIIYTTITHPDTFDIFVKNFN